MHAQKRFGTASVISFPPSMPCERFKPEAFGEFTLSAIAAALLRYWLIFLAVFEIPPIYRCLAVPTAPLEGFATNLAPGRGCVR